MQQYGKNWEKIQELYFPARTTHQIRAKFFGLCYKHEQPEGTDVAGLDSLILKLNQEN